VSFFTPRGPLALAAALHRRTGAAWLADLQDVVLEGCGPALRPIVARWMRRTLRSAARVVQVSPEWASFDSMLLRREVEFVRHAIPNMGLRRRAQAAAGKEFVLLYAGSISLPQQDPLPLIKAIANLNAGYPAVRNRRIVLEVAGASATFRQFAAVAEQDKVEIRELGWLEQDVLNKRMQSADALVLIPWSTADRSVIPSKLFEY